MLEKLANLLNDPVTDANAMRWSETGNEFCINERLIRGTSIMERLAGGANHFASFYKRLNLRGIYEVETDNREVRMFKSRYEPPFSRANTSITVSGSGSRCSSPAHSRTYSEDTHHTENSENSNSRDANRQLEATLSDMQSRMLSMAGTAAENLAIELGAEPPSKARKLRYQTEPRLVCAFSSSNTSTISTSSISVKDAWPRRKTPRSQTSCT